jgi:hypothetical protein
MKILTEIKEFQVLAGTDIKEAIEEAIKIATENNCIVRFYANSIEMIIYDFSDIKENIDYYGKRLKGIIK